MGNAIAVTTFLLVLQHGPGLPGPAQLLPGMGRHTHPITTSSAEAQKYFDQGLVLCYNFNHEEAIRSFRKAAELDPRAPMPWWGIAYALGPNYNLPMEPEPARQAWTALQKALELSANTTGPERDYIEALRPRYAAEAPADRSALDQAFALAMRQLSAKYPDDTDAASFFAESLMVLNPWKLWTKEGQPAPGTEEIVRVLESVLRRDPAHPGANHYYIHAMEASPWPERALPSAGRLHLQAPGAGHLVHMPGHIYLNVGDYESAAAINEAAVRADREYLRLTGASGVYPVMYASHNIHFVAYARAEQGRFEESWAAARELAEHVKPVVEAMPMAEAFVIVPVQSMLRFRRWDLILAEPEPPAKTRLWHGFWRMARAHAFAGQGKLREAEAEAARFRAENKEMPPDAMWGANNTYADILKVAGVLLDAHLAERNGKRDQAIQLYAEASAAQDNLIYDEPPAWFFPVRESWGGALLRAGRATEAEKVFRQGLDQHRRNPRLLFGLWKALEAQGRKDAAPFIQRQFEDAWSRATSQLKVDDL